MKLDLPIRLPIHVAREWYWRWQSIVPFEQDLREYLENGIVISRYDLFAMAKMDGDTLFVRMACGNLRTLLANLPVLPPFISFYRGNKGKLKKYNLAKMLKMTDKLTRRAQNV